MRAYILRINLYQPHEVYLIDTVHYTNRMIRKISYTYIGLHGHYSAYASGGPAGG